MTRTSALLALSAATAAVVGAGPAHAATEPTGAAPSITTIHTTATLAPASTQNGPEVEADRVWRGSDDTVLHIGGGLLAAVAAGGTFAARRRH